MQAGNLQLGDVVKTKTGLAELVKKEAKPGRHTVYNLEVHQSHTYYVSNIGVLAHNTCPPKADRNLQISNVEIKNEIEKVLDLIESKSSLPYKRDGIVFQNLEGRLPKANYKEYTVTTPGAKTRGARRLVINQKTGEVYYTGDHYGTFTKLNYKIKN